MVNYNDDDDGDDDTKTIIIIGLSIALGITILTLAVFIMCYCCSRSKKSFNGEKPYVEKNDVYGDDDYYEDEFTNRLEDKNEYYEQCL